MQRLDEYLERVPNLPTSPRILPQLLGLLAEDNVDCERIVELIMYDPSLTAHLLQICNKVAFAGATRVTDVSEAVGRLGFQQTYRLVAVIAGGRSLSPPQEGYGLAEGELWHHSVASAIAAQCVARNLGDDENLPFTAALLHDIGKIVLGCALDETYDNIVRETEERQQSLLDTEMKLLGVQHAEVGGRLLDRWQFPESLVSAVWFHHHPVTAKPYDRLAAIVYLGNVIAYFLGHGYGHQAFAMHGRSEALTLLGLESGDLPRMMIQTVEDLAKLDVLFQPNN